MKFKFKANLTGVTAELLKGAGDFAALYTEDADGTYSLPESLHGVAAAIDGVNTALGQARGEAKTLKDGQHDLSALSEYGDTVDSIVESIGTRMEALESKGGDSAAKIEAVKKGLQEAHGKLLGAKDSRISMLESGLKQQLVDNQLGTAIASHKGNAALLLPALRNMVEVTEADGKFAVRVLNDEGTERYNDAGESMTIPQLVAVMKADDSFAPCFSSDTPPGGGTPPGGNPPGGPRGGRKVDPSTMTPAQKIRAGVEAQ